MTWVRYYSKKFLGPYLGYMAPEKAQKWLTVVRMAYFFSASSLLLVCLRIKRKLDEQQLESGETAGKPVISDLSPAHKQVRESGKETGIIYSFSGKGLQRIEYHRDEYLQQIEKEAFERAKEAQRKAIAEGKELPPDAIKLV